MIKLSPRVYTLWERIFPWLILTVLLFFTHARFFILPYAGFRYSSSGEIVQIFTEPTNSQPSLALGDTLVQVGHISWESFADNPRRILFEDIQPGATVSLTIKREGLEENLVIPWQFPGPNTNEIIERINSEWWLGYVFWLAGLMTMLLVRPRDIRWLILQLFVFISAIWLSTGGFAETHIGNNLLVFKSAIWLAVPVYLHLHWIFPRRLSRLPAGIWLGLYLMAALLAAAEWLQLVPGGIYLVAFLIGLAGSGLILLIRYIFRPDQRSGINLLVGGVLLALAPLVGILIVGFLNIEIPAFLAGGSLLAFPAIPGAYFFTLYRQQLGSLEKRANRLVRIYVIAVGVGTALIILLSTIIGQTAQFVNTPLFNISSLLVLAVLAIVSFSPFFSLAALATAYGMAPDLTDGMMRFRTNKLFGPLLFFIFFGALLTSLSILIESQLSFPGIVFLTGIGMAILGGIIVIGSYAAFLRLVDKYLLGISLPPDDLLEQFASRIPTNLERQSLMGLLTHELMPSLLIRQSALLQIQNYPSPSQSLNLLYNQGVAETELPQVDQLITLLEQTNHYRNGSIRREDPELCFWARVIFPLYLGDRLIGLWLLGHRDPDDLYSQQEIESFRILADQTAVALANVFQSENLYALYQTNIERQESERTRLARELHDEVLNQLGLLRMEVAETAVDPEFERIYQELKTYLRLTISGLRPAALTYGLPLAINELVESLNYRAEHSRNGPSFQVSLEATVDRRYPPDVEQHLFRIIQQAASNALNHAQAKTIIIRGTLEEEMLAIEIADDGIGFENGHHPELRTLLSQKHFGLISMYERARLIGAALNILSKPTEGTQVLVVWHLEPSQ